MAVPGGRKNPGIFLRRINNSVDDLYKEMVKQREAKKSPINLKDYGITFEKYRRELEHGISCGYQPHFGYPTLKFNSVVDGLKAMTYED